MPTKTVWPGLLCFIGAAPVVLVLGYIAILGYASARQGIYLADDTTVLIRLLSLLLPAIWLLTVSLLLLLDGPRKTIWGILATATFGLATIFSFLFFGLILSETQIENLNLWIFVPVFAGPILGLVGAVWALPLKTASSTKEQ